MTSLITIVRNKFLEAIRSVNPPGKWKILVVDDFSQKLLGSVLKQFDILEENVTLIESISNYRDPQPGFEAMYLLMPTSQNVDRIIKDFSNGTQQYSAAHLFFIEGLDEQLFQKLTASPAEPFLQGLKELFLNFWVTEAQAFSIQDPGLFFSLYSPPRSDAVFKPSRIRLEEDLRFVSKMISNLCITLNEFPFIRYYVPPHHPPLGPLKPHAETRPPPPAENSSRWRTQLARGAEARAYESVETDHCTKLLAFLVQSNLEEHKKANPDFAKTSATSHDVRPRATLFITDRSMDMLAPFIHEFTYQAMANDLLPIHDGTKYTYKFQSSLGAYEDKTATLSDSDTVWTEVRHMHMREAIDKLMADFNKFLADNAVFKGEGAASLTDMKEMLASLPQYQEHREKFSLHLNMAQECMAIFERDKLPLVANVEQNCATGLTAEGKTPKNLVEEMVPLLDSREVVNSNKVRIVALYIQHRDGVPEEDRRRLYQHARLTLAEQDAVNALTLLGVRIGRTAADRDTKKKIKHKSNEEEYELSRFKPLLRAVLEEHVAGKLDPTLFPYVKEAPSAAPPPTSLRSPPPQATSLRSQKPSWHRAPKSGSIVTENKQRILVFIAGGMTYSELRECYQLSGPLNKDIYIGSTHAVTPRHFLDDLKVLDLGGVGSRAIPNGVREDLPGLRSFQEYYDEKYYTKDAPPPRPPPPALSVPRDSRKPSKISPTNSFASSVNSMTPSSTPTTPSGKDEKKKKRGGLFRF
ncbi:Protein transport protein sec1 [Hypsizygus marmoreus]|uniref:Protein transport protein sec1 n=1 Tax=Hypsizygus marmoreus TaxID=39966 RepID=A0A369JP87_HYPMA|nr:Protein transport protein sec1 [Hypsizygus marmoreus]